MTENKLKYTSLTHEDILKQVYDRFLKNRDGTDNRKFDNFRESSLGQTLIEIFAGTVDINNYYIQRRAEECYFDTAQLKSSVISLSRMFAYDMSRISPAKAGMTIILEGDFRSVFGNGVTTNIIQIPTLSKFSTNGENFVLLNTIKIDIDVDTLEDMKNLKENFKKEFDLDSDGQVIEIIQGDVKEKFFDGRTNTQINAQFQIYKVDDKSFSNLYGNKDIFNSQVTRVYVGDEKVDGFKDDATDNKKSNQYKIDRRSLLNWENIVVDDLSTSSAVCLLRTANDGTMELLFGDDKYAAKGPTTSKDNIYVQYLSTNGLDSNAVGVIGDGVDFSSSIYTANGTDISNMVSFKLATNISGGANEESMDSIKYSAPKIYYSLDRLVAKQDYIAYLKSITTPINIKNAVAWGEQEETDKYGVFALWKMFNVVLFSVVASLYNLTGNEYTAKAGGNLEDAVLDVDYDAFSFPTQSYFNIFIGQNQVNQLHRYRRRTEYPSIRGNVVASSNDDTVTPTALATTVAETYSADGVVGTLYIKYTSNNVDFGPSIEKNESFVVDINPDNKPLTGNNRYNNIDLGNDINTALVDFIDQRGYRDTGAGMTGTNHNYGDTAFVGRLFNEANPGEPPKICKWDNTNNRYIIAFNDKKHDNNSAVASPCYISVLRPSPNDTGLGELIGLVNVSDDARTENDVEWITDAYKGTISSKIVDVVKDLESRSQTSVKNVYISPIIHIFNLVGRVVVKSLFDIEEVRVDIFNSLYDWFDINIDFNTDIYKSNIIEVIERQPGVAYVDVNIAPKDITNGPVVSEDEITNASYTIYLMREIASDYGTSTINTMINTALTKYLGVTPDPDPESGDNVDTYDVVEWYRGMGYYSGPRSTRSYEITLEEYRYDINNSINERSFYVNFVSPLFNDFCGLMNTGSQSCGDDKCEHKICPLPKDDNGNSIGDPNWAKFLGKCETADSKENQLYNSYKYKDPLTDSDFGRLMQAIHRDLSYIIMQNMIDTNGNIRTEIDSDGNYVKGGYSLGSEIVQIDLDRTHLEFIYQ